MSKISVVIPTYNTSKHLEECLDSVCNQTLEDIEIICVDDGSSDNCVEIIKKYAVLDPRFKLIVHEKNMGLLKSRGDGAKSALSKYTMFLDSDDTYTKDAFEKLYNFIEATQADMVQFGSEVIPDETVDKELVDAYVHFLEPCTTTLKEKEVFEGLFNGLYTWHVWNKIYLTELIKKSYLAAGDQYLIFSDDLYIAFFTSFYSKHSEGVCEKYYKYNLGRGYTGSSNDELKRLTVACKNAWFIDNCVSFLKEEGLFEKYKDYCYRAPLLQLPFCFSIWSGIDDKKVKKEGLKVLKKYWGREPYCYMLNQMLLEYNEGKSTTQKIKLKIKLKIKSIKEKL